MANENSEKAAQYIKIVQNELSLVLGTLKDKGSARFGRTFAIGALGVFFSYYLVYLPPFKKMSQLSRKIEAAKAIAQYADQYKELRDKLNAIYGQLPAISSRDRWLTNAVLDSMKAENLMSDSIVPPDEQEMKGIVFQRLTVSIQLKFSEMVSWLNRIEASKPILHVGSLDMQKKADPLGTNAISCEIGTAMPLHRPQ
jgi:hypothetical protein